MGRDCRPACSAKFAMTISIAIMISLAISLATTPMMCARGCSAAGSERRHGRLYWASERFFEGMLGFYRRTPDGCGLNTPRLGDADPWPAVLGLNFYLYQIIPKGFFPQQDTGRIIGIIQADQSISFSADAAKKLTQFRKPSSRTMQRSKNRGRLHRRGTDQFRVHVRLPVSTRPARRSLWDGVIARPAPRERWAGGCRGATLFFAGGAGHSRRGTGQPMRSISIRCRARRWRSSMTGPQKIVAALQGQPNLADVNSDQQKQGTGGQSCDRPRCRRPARDYR